MKKPKKMTAPTVPPEEQSHDHLYAYVELDGGGCIDVATISFKGHALVPKPYLKKLQNTLSSQKVQKMVQRSDMHEHLAVALEKLVTIVKQAHPNPSSDIEFEIDYAERLIRQAKEIG